MEQVVSTSDGCYSSGSSPYGIRHCAHSPGYVSGTDHAKRSCSEHPAFFQRREPLRSRWTRLHFDSPTSAMLGHPGFEVVVVILLIREDRDETRKVLRSDVAEHQRGHPVIQTCTRHHDGYQEAERVDQHIRLRPLTFSAIVPTLGPPISVVLTDGLSMQAALGVGSRPASTRGRSRRALTKLAQVPSSRHWAKSS